MKAASEYINLTKRVESLEELPECMLIRRQLLVRPSQSGSLAVTSITFAAVICEADGALFSKYCVCS